MTNITKTKIRYNREWEEYRVLAYDKDGKRLPEADYFTDDKDDAENTAWEMVHYKGAPQ